MRIVDVQAYPLMQPIEPLDQVPVSVPKPTSTGRLIFGGYRALLVRIETDEGISGVGEGLVRLAPRATEHIVLEVKPLLIGRDPLEVEVIWDDLYSTMANRGHDRGFMLEAISAVDIALWDVYGKALGLSVGQALGGIRTPRVPCYASSVRIKDPTKCAEDAARLVADGFNAIKLKVGRGPDRVDEDIDAVREVRSAIGPDVDLMVDANCGFNFRNAVRVGRALEECNVAWFEEPLPPNDLEHYRLLREKLDVPIAAGETWFSRFDYRRPLQMGAVDIVQPDVSRCGGITEARRIAWLASAFNCDYAPHTGQSSLVCLVASLHLASSMPNVVNYEFVTSDWSPSTGNALRLELGSPDLNCLRDGSFLALPTDPGLGVEINWQKVEEYRVG